MSKRTKRLAFRLPLSYAAVALLAAVSLGLVLLFTLQRYYQGQERQYLAGNAQAAGEVIGRLWATEAHNPPAAIPPLLQSQAATFAFLTQTRVRLYDPEEKLVADSGDPEELQASLSLSLQVNMADGRQAFSQTVGLGGDDQALTSVVVVEGEGSRFQSSTSVSGDPAGQTAGLLLPLSSLETPYSFGSSRDDGQTPRSNQSMRQPVWANEGNELLGYVELSAGPAVGRAIMASVGRALVLAGSVAVVLAAVTGWAISLRLSRPIHGLARTTEQMAAGDLSVRAAEAGPDELIQLSRSFNHMAGRTQQTVETLHHFVADAAHELNTPLTALRTNLELAGQRYPDDEQIAAAQDQAGRLEQLSDNLLQLSRLESGLDEQVWRPVDLTEMLATAGERYAARVEQQNILFDLALPNEPVTIAGDAPALLRAVDNLVDNGLEFTPTAGQVALSLAAEDGWAVVTVADTGIGIPPEELSHIFGRFRRCRNAAGYPGNGLGLAIVEAIVTRHGGQVLATSGNAGTIFRLQLPLSPSTS